MDESVSVSNGKNGLDMNLRTGISPKGVNNLISLENLAQIF